MFSRYFFGLCIIAVLAFAMHVSAQPEEEVDERNPVSQL